jgi:hypothetical protein
MDRRAERHADFFESYLGKNISFKKEACFFNTFKV